MKRNAELRSSELLLKKHPSTASSSFLVVPLSVKTGLGGNTVLLVHNERFVNYFPHEFTMIKLAIGKQLGEYCSVR